MTTHQATPEAREPEIDDYTRRGHERFKSQTVLDCGDGKPRTMNQWLAWMKTWDPLAKPPVKGPGIARRPR